MKTFEFKLEKILQLRMFYEERAKIDLGRAVSELESLKVQLEQIAKEKVKTRNEMGFKDFELQSFISSEQYLKNLDIKKEQILNKVVEAELAVEKAREVFLEATQKRKVLTKLREKQVAVWKKEAEREEAENIDDVVNSKFSS